MFCIICWSFYILLDRELDKVLFGYYYSYYLIWLLRWLENAGHLWIRHFNDTLAWTTNYIRRLWSYDLVNCPQYYTRHVSLNLLPRQTSALFGLSKYKFLSSTWYLIRYLLLKSINCPHVSNKAVYNPLSLQVDKYCKLSTKRESYIHS